MIIQTIIWSIERNLYAFIDLDVPPADDIYSMDIPIETRND